jgi:hypothetical protein
MTRTQSWPASTSATSADPMNVDRHVSDAFAASSPEELERAAHHLAAQR